MAGFFDAVPWIIAAVGWGATHLLSEARERRKEVRAQIDKLSDRLAKLQDDAIKFHTQAAYDDRGSAAILSEIDRMERLVARNSRFDSDCFIAVIIQHRRAITYKNFDKSAFVQQPFDSDLLAEVNVTTQAFEDELEAQYRISYPSRFPYFQIRK